MIIVQSEHFPPSVNALFANVAGKGRVRTKRYKEWSSAAGWDANGKGSIKGPFSVAIILSQSHRRSNADLDNRIKPLLDLLQDHGIIENDSMCEEIRVAWGHCPGFYIEVSPYPIEKRKETQK